MKRYTLKLPIAYFIQDETIYIKITNNLFYTI